MKRSPLWLVLAAIAATQVGAAIAKTQFDAVSPVAMVWLRLTFAGLLLLLLKPSFRGLSRKDWIAGLALAGSLAAMNWAIYEAFARIPLGLAVTIEFLGPLSIALLGCQRVLDVVWVVLAASGIILLGLGPATLDPVGVAFAALAGAGWAGYIYFGSRLPSQWKGSSVLLLSCALGSVLLTPAAITAGGTSLLSPTILLTGLVVGLLSSALPYSLELRALKLIPRRIFGVLQSLGPAAAAVAALLILRERLGLVEWLAICCIVVASIGATWRQRQTPIAPAN